MEWFKNHRNLLLVEGILFTLLGLVAIALPIISTFGTELFIGWLLIFGGAIQLYRAFQGSSQRIGFGGSLLTGLLYLIFGILLIAFPLAGVISLTILLTFFFIAEGIAKIILGFQLRPFNHWSWLILNGVIALIMAFIIWSGWPETAFWVLGLLVGINMIFFGMSLIFISREIPHDDIKT